MNTKQSEHKMRTSEARIKEEQEAKDKVKRAQAKLWERMRTCDARRALKSMNLKGVK